MLPTEASSYARIRDCLARIDMTFATSLEGIMSHERPAPRSGALPRRITHTIMMRYRLGVTDLLTPPSTLDVEEVHLLLQCRDTTTGERVTVFQSDREFTWQELAPHHRRPSDDSAARASS